MTEPRLTSAEQAIFDQQAAEAAAFAGRTNADITFTPPQEEPS